MDFSLSPQQIELRDAILAFGAGQLRDDLIRRDAAGTFSRELWLRCAEFGITGLPFPEAYGGSGLDALTTVVAMEALGRSCPDAGLAFGIAAQMWSVQMPIFRYGTEEQRERYLRPLCEGTWIGAHGMSEPDSGSDAFALRTTARREGDRYVLNGTKTWVTNAPVADCFLVFATIDPTLGPMGVTGFLVDRDTPGFTVSPPISKMGLRTSPMAELIFEDCSIPVGNRLGREGRGAQLFNDSMEWERSCILAGCVGAMERQIEVCVRYARERMQFGRPIGSFQSVANRIVAMKVRHETSRLLLYRAAWLRDRKEPSGEAAAVAKLHISDAWVQSCLDAVQVHGGYGFTTEFELERDLRDSVGGLLYSGTSDIQRVIIARALGL